MTPCPFTAADESCSSAASKGGIDEVMPIEAVALDGDKKRIRTDFAGIDGDGADMVLMPRRGRRWPQERRLGCREVGSWHSSAVAAPSRRTLPTRGEIRWNS